MSTLTLNIPKEERERLLTEGPKALRPLLQKFFEQSDASKVVKSLRQLRQSCRKLLKPSEAALPLVVRPAFEPESEDDEDGNTHPLHHQFVEELANTIGKIMVSHRDAASPFADAKKEDQEAANPSSDENNKDGKADVPLSKQEIKDREEAILVATNLRKSREGIIRRISEQDAKTMAERLKTEPKYYVARQRWIQYVAGHPEWRVFTQADFPTSWDLAKKIRELRDNAVIYTRKSRGDGEETDALEALITDLFKAMVDCESVECYLSISVYMFWVATGLWDLPTHPDLYLDKENVWSLLRYYVAAALLDASVV